MEELTKEYLVLFNGITDTIRQLEHTITRLKMLQQRAEEIYLLGAEAAETRDEHEPREDVGAMLPQ